MSYEEFDNPGLREEFLPIVMDLCPEDKGSASDDQWLEACKHGVKAATGSFETIKAKTAESYEHRRSEIAYQLIKCAMHARNAYLKANA